MQKAKEALAVPAPDPLLDLALARLSVCPRAAQSDLLACLTHLRHARGEGDDKDQSIAAIDRYHARVISMSSRGLERHEDRALTLMAMAITAMRDNTPSSNAQAERTLRQIRKPITV
jgi:hypothetical protein